MTSAPGPSGDDGSQRLPARAADFAPAARRTKRRRVPEPGCGSGTLGLDGSIPESAVFSALRAAEEKIDAALAARLAGLRDALRVAGSGGGGPVAPPRAPRRLRLHAQVECSPQTAGDPPRWVVTLYGGLVEPGEVAGLGPGSEKAEAAAAPRPPRSFLASVRRLRIEGGPPGHDWVGSGPLTAAESPLGGGPGGKPAVIQWARSSALGVAAAHAPAGSPEASAALAALAPALTVRRVGDQAMDLRVTVEADGYAERVRPSPALAAVLGSGEPLTRAAAFEAVMRYAASSGCFAAASAPGILTLDAKLAAVLGGFSGAAAAAAPTVSAADVPAALAAHLSPCPPPGFVVPVRPGPSASVITHSWELEVEAPVEAAAPDAGGGAGGGAATHPPPPPLSGADRAVASFADALAHDPAIAAADADLATALRRLREHARRREFYLGFALDPAAFIDGLASAQAADLRAVSEKGGGVPGGGAGVGMPGASVFAGKWVDEVLAKLLQRRQAAGQ